jgi:MFS family permease
MQSKRYFTYRATGFGITTSLSRLVRSFGTAPLVNAGLAVLSLALALMASLQYVEPWLLPVVAATVGRAFGLPFIHGLVPPMMVVSLLLGVGYALASVPSQALLMERAPAQSRGRIFAVWLMLTNVASILPLLFLGGLADLIGVSPTIGLVAAIVLAAGGYSYTGAKREGLVK